MQLSRGTIVPSLHFAVLDHLPALDLEDCLGSEQGRMGFLDETYTPILPTPAELCLCPRLREAAKSCGPCPARRGQEGGGPAQFECEEGILITTCPVLVQNRTVGHVIHQRVLPEFFQRNPSIIAGFDIETQEVLERLKEKPPDNWGIAESVRHTAKRVGRRITKVRGYYIVGWVEEGLCRAAKPEDVLDLLFRGLQELTADASVSLYVLNYDGRILLLGRQRTRRD